MDTWGSGRRWVRSSPDGAEQRCWNHRLTNVIDHLPKKEWSAAKELLRKMPYALSRAECEQLRDQFAARYRRLCPKAVETLSRDLERMVTFYPFPKDHLIHLRTTNPVESPFSAVRLRTDAASRYKKVANALIDFCRPTRIAWTSWGKTISSRSGSNDTCSLADVSRLPFLSLRKSISVNPESSA
jgi:hypothetical protein